jgi:hypothetical protein
MKNYFLLLLACFLSVSIYAQSTERFIRIIGNTKREFSAKGVILNLTIAELQPNEYKQIKYKPFETVYSEFVTELGKIGIAESQLVQDQKNLGKFTQTVSKEYSIRLPDLNYLEKMATIQMSGVNYTDTRYTFGTLDEDIETQMAKAAIDDARGKHKNYAVRCL